jgi:hypothetical protein
VKGTPTISKKALHMQGPLPTDHGLTWPNRLRNAQNKHHVDACDRTGLP